ncbi:13173_t:CDS:2, partial [Racocetra fulgida]
MHRFALDVLGKAAFGIDFDKLDNLFDEIVEKKREALTNENTKKQGDLLELMLKACEDPENPKLTNIEFRDVQRKAREEILRVLGDDLTPSIEQQKSLKYLDMILHENLRLYPP